MDRNASIKPIVPTLTPPAATAAGFSLVEVMFAAVLLLIVILGILPMFAQAGFSNFSGNESSLVSNHGRSRVEEYFQLPFNSAELTIDAGTEKVVDEYFSKADQIWKAGAPPPGDPAEWTRTTTVRQYNIESFADGEVDPADALPAGTPPINVHIKEILVTVRGTRLGGPWGPAKRIALRTLKSQ